MITLILSLFINAFAPKWAIVGFFFFSSWWDGDLTFGI